MIGRLRPKLACMSALHSGATLSAPNDPKRLPQSSKALMVLIAKALAGETARRLARKAQVHVFVKCRALHCPAVPNATPFSDIGAPARCACRRCRLRSARRGVGLSAIAVRYSSSRFVVPSGPHCARNVLQRYRQILDHLPRKVRVSVSVHRRNRNELGLICANIKHWARSVVRAPSAQGGAVCYRRRSLRKRGVCFPPIERSRAQKPTEHTSRVRAYSA